MPCGDTHIPARHIERDPSNASVAAPDVEGNGAVHARSGGARERSAATRSD
jgi:hypothetical protein